MNELEGTDITAKLEIGEPQNDSLVARDMGDVLPYLSQVSPKEHLRFQPKRERVQDPSKKKN